MKKLLLILTLINPAAYAMQMGQKDQDLRQRLIAAEQEIQELKGTVKAQTGAYIASQTTMTALTCCCTGLFFALFNEKMNLIAHKCK